MTRAMLALALVLAAAPARSAERAQWLMGTELRIVVDAGDLDPAAVDSLLDDCFDLARDTERVLSRWDPQAELARLNAAAGQQVQVSPALFAWLQRCVADARLTGGAFDPTVGTWILNPGSEVPIGMDRLRLDPARRTVFLPAGMALDSGGDGKGVAVDRIVERLRRDVSSALVSFGGSSCFGLGPGPEGEGWPLAVVDVDGSWVGTVTLRDRALSVSQSMQVDQLGDGQTVRRAHIYDPATGELVREPRTSVVVAPSATVAEVLSTALVVRGREGLSMLDTWPETEALVSPFSDPAPSWWQPAHPRR